MNRLIAHEPPTPLGELGIIRMISLALPCKARRRIIGISPIGARVARTARVGRKVSPSSPGGTQQQWWGSKMEVGLKNIISGGYLDNSGSSPSCYSGGQIQEFFE